MHHVLGAFNQWLDEDWGLNYKGRIFASPYVTLADVDWACAQLEWALERDARILVMRPSAVFTRNGPRSPGHKDFDPFWARVNEAGITVVTHIGATRHDSNGYDTKSIDTAQSWDLGRVSPTFSAPETSTTSLPAWCSTGSSNASPIYGSPRSKTAQNFLADLLRTFDRDQGACR